MTKITGYKGFDKDLTCRGFVYKEGDTFRQEGGIKVCEKGFHYCENPLDVFNYYAPGKSEYAQIEALGDVKKKEDKSVTDQIKIVAKLDLPMLIKASVDFIWNNASKKSIFKKGNATSGNKEMEFVRKQIQDCEGKHAQQVAYSTFHDALTQICFGCRKIRSTIDR